MHVLYHKNSELCYNIFMAIIVNNQQEQSELQRRVTAELREKQAGKSRDAGGLAAPEYDVDKSEYLKNTAVSTLPGWIWLVGLVVAAAAAFLIAKFLIK